MFKRLQLKMTITYTLILIAILSVTDLGVYYFLQRYNDFQMTSEVSRMLESIKSSEWLIAPEEIDETNEENELNSDETTEDDGGTSGGTSTEDNEATTEDYHSNDTESTEHEDSTDAEDTDGKDESEDTHDDDSNKGDSDGNGGGSDSVSKDSLPAFEDLIIPQTLSTFDYYMVFDHTGQLTYWKSDNADIFDRLLEKSRSIKESESPKIVELSGEKSLYFLLAKMPIEIESESLGYYVVAREVTAAYETLDNLLRVLIISLFFGVFVSAGLGYLMAGRSLKPIREAYVSKQEFLANASHELKTPLSVIMLSTETLEGEINPELAFQRQVVTDIKEETQKMNHLVSELLFLSRSDSRTTTANYEHFNMSEALENEITSYEKLADSKGLKVSTTLSPNVKVLGDRKQLLSVVTILVDNAIKYSKSGGQIFIELDKIKANNTKQGVKLIVKDTGIGIPEQDLKRIFERFYRSETSRSKETGGYGLGLAIAKEIVEQHGGTIRVDSIEKVGTTFTIEL